MDKTKIEWTDATWNPLRGCSKVSEGCRNCYAERVAARFSGPGMPYAGVATHPAYQSERYGGINRPLPQWTGKVILVEKNLEQPLRWKRPRRIFVNSMSDLFHEAVPDSQIDLIFAVMAIAPKHTFQILTKRAERMRGYLSATGRAAAIADAGRFKLKRMMGMRLDIGAAWPLPNVWLGVSVENQNAADERVPLLLQTPAAVRWVSAEPLLEEVNLAVVGKGATVHMPLHGASVTCPSVPSAPHHVARLDWVVVGGESGHGARPFHAEWARRIVNSCWDAAVAVFVKQLGADPRTGDIDTSAGAINDGRLRLNSKKGGDMSEWPRDLRVRQFPLMRAHEEVSA